MVNPDFVDETIVNIDLNLITNLNKKDQVLKKLVY